MSLLYRAVWTAAVDDVATASIDTIRMQIASWAQEAETPEPLADGQTERKTSQGGARSVTHRPLGDSAFEVLVSDRHPTKGTEWTTLIRVIADEHAVQTLVENRVESEDLALRVAVGRPRIVHDMLRVATRPCLGGSGLRTEVLEIRAAEISVLMEHLASPDRTLPVIVCSEPGSASDDAWNRTAHKIAARVEGVATVATLDSQAVTAFKEQLGELAIWGGGIRVYVPGPVLPGSDGWRHRFYRGAQLDEAPKPTIDRIVYSVTQLSARRRVPDTFRMFDEQAGSLLDGAAPLVRASELDAERDDREFERELAIEERSELEKELSRATGHLARLKDALNRQGLSDLLWGTEHETDASVPDEVQVTSEAVLAAQVYLSQWLAVPDTAARDLDEIDTAPTAYAWGNNTWRGLRALAAYAEDRNNGWDKGGFWEWCASGPALGWPASSKKLSMSESETVQNNSKLARARIFKIEKAVSDSGEITMLAHLKISEGGGNLAPRVYFFDDTGGTTGKVHVGLVGPHYLVPNKSTN